MHRTFVAILLLCACGSTPGAGTGSHPPPSPCSLETDGGTPFKATLDLGQTFVGEELAGRVTFVNRGGTACKVLPIGDDLTPFATDFACGASCGAVDVEPGRSLSIGFSFDPTKVGFYDQTLSIPTGIKGTPLQIRLRAVARDWNVVCTPSALDLDTVVQGTAGTATITCKNEGLVTTTFGLKVVDGGSGLMTLPSTNGPVSLDPAYSIDIPVLFQAAHLGQGLDSLPFAGEVHVDDDQEQKRITIPVTASVISSALEIDPPPPYDFGFVTPGSDAYITVILRNRSTEPMTITQLALDPGSDPEFESDVFAAVPFTIRGRDPSMPGWNQVSFEIHFNTTTDDLGARMGWLDLGADDPGGKTQSLLQLSGFAGGPSMSCSWAGAPSPLDFGPTPVGNPRTLEIACTNDSRFDDPSTDADNLVVLAPTMQSDSSSYQATITGGPLKQGYAVGQGFTIEVQYDPARTSDQDDDQVVLRTNSTTQHQVDIPVTGSATQ